MTKTQEWITENFEYLVYKYVGKYIGVVDEEVVSVALSAKEVLEIAQKAGKQEETVSILKVPTEEELICVL